MFPLWFSKIKMHFLKSKRIEVNKSKWLFKFDVEKRLLWLCILFLQNASSGLFELLEKIELFNFVVIINYIRFRPQTIKENRLVRPLWFDFGSFALFRTKTTNNFRPFLSLPVDLVNAFFNFNFQYFFRNVSFFFSFFFWWIFLSISIEGLATFLIHLSSLVRQI